METSTITLPMTVATCHTCLLKLISIKLNCRFSSLVSTMISLSPPKLTLTLSNCCGRLRWGLLRSAWDGDRSLMSTLMQSCRRGSSAQLDLTRVGCYTASLWAAWFSFFAHTCWIFRFSPRVRSARPSPEQSRYWCHVFGLSSHQKCELSGHVFFINHRGIYSVIAMPTN